MSGSLSDLESMQKELGIIKESSKRYTFRILQNPTETDLYSNLSQKQIQSEVVGIIEFHPINTSITFDLKELQQYSIVEFETTSVIVFTKNKPQRSCMYCEKDFRDGDTIISIKTRKKYIEIHYLCWENIKQNFENTIEQNKAEILSQSI